MTLYPKKTFMIELKLVAVLGGPTKESKKHPK